MKILKLFFVIFILLVTLTEVNASVINTRNGEDDFLISLDFKGLNPMENEPIVFLCREICISTDVKSVSFNENGEIDIFIKPEYTGNYTLKVFFNSSEELLLFEDEIEISEIYKSEEFLVEEDFGVTGNIVRNSTNPLFLLGFLSLVIILMFFKLDNDVIFEKNKFLRHFKTKLKPFIVFMLSFVVLTVFTHELFHIITAGIFGCAASLESFLPIYSPSSVSISSCKITSFQSIMILSAGIIGNMMVGLFLLYFPLKRNKKILNTVSLAFFVSSFSYFFYKTGDIHNIINIMNLSIPQIYLNIFGVLTLSGSFYLFLRNYN